MWTPRRGTSPSPSWLLASASPGGEQLVEQILQVSREGLSDSLHDGFIFTLVAVSAAIVAALLMKNIRLGEEGNRRHPSRPPAPPGRTGWWRGSRSSTWPGA